MFNLKDIHQLQVLPLDAATALLSSAMIKGGCMATKNFRQVPKMEVLNLIAGYFGVGFHDFPLQKPYPYSFHFRYLKRLVML